MSGAVIIPVKSFASGKQRLSGALDPGARGRLGRALAGHVAETVAATGCTPHVVTGDVEVASWAQESGYQVVDDPGEGLSAAARAAASWSVRLSQPWLILHSDLPWVTVEDIEALMSVLEDGRSVIAPSADGGTSAIGSSGVFSFEFGPASFHRHLAALTPHPVIVARPGLLLDIDAPADLQAAVSSAPGAWLKAALRPQG